MIVRIVSIVVCLFGLLCGSFCQADESGTQEYKAQELTLQVPKAWKEKPTANKLRLAQFEIPAMEGDSEPAELAVFPPFGGSVAENIKRWVGQFESEGMKATFTQGKVAQGAYVLADISGTYQKPDGPPIARKTKPAPNYRMIAVILSTEKEGNYFLKLTGPEKTVAAAADALRKSFGANAAQEEKFEF